MTYSKYESDQMRKHFLKKKLKIFIGSWNMNNQDPHIEINSFIKPSVEHNVDIIIFGTQESFTYVMEKWEYKIQKAIGSTYIMKAKSQLGKLYIFLFVRYELRKFTSVHKMKSVLPSTSTVLKTKGAISLTLTIFGKNLLFVNTHLIPHSYNWKKRYEQLTKIVDLLGFYESDVHRKIKNLRINFDVIFYFGDFNFRLNLPRENVMNLIRKTHYPTEISVISSHDQLKILLDTNSILQGFCETDITFPPTYKFDYGTQVLDSSQKRRTPSYTDRILHKNKLQYFLCNLDHKLIKSGVMLTDIIYDSIRNVRTSDHKPVYGIYHINFFTDIYTSPNKRVLYGLMDYVITDSHQKLPVKVFF
ncbi:inositol polyphosphate 5-phosphatase E [Phymastichus coffea]|uniref:inositol polyphosphate 5-phosphatase E n=1 Tax=Phymastichus coffea TaxID=108790 RepID=UPI00273BB316|nr:inositol polyphosphate 5-phosphatase E [Phymastichus coffea]